MNETIKAMLFILSLSFLSSAKFLSAGEKGDFHMDEDTDPRASLVRLCGSMHKETDKETISKGIEDIFKKYKLDINEIIEIHHGRITNNKKKKYYSKNPDGINRPLVNASGTLFFAACFYGYDKLASDLLLLDLVDISRRSKAQWSPLFAACRNGHERIVWAIINNNPSHNCKEQINFNNTDQYGGTPLTTASAYNYSAIVQILIEGGANVNLCEKITGASPLAFAAMNGNYDIVNLLLSAGADVNNGNHPPLTLAKNNYEIHNLEIHKKCIDILESHTRNQMI